MDRRRSTVVIDASVAIARLRDERWSDTVRQAFRTWSDDGTRLIVPRSFWWEVSNVLARQHHYSGDQVLEAIHELETLGIETRDPDRGSLLVALTFMERFDLTAYGAAYLTLAEELSIPLATLDRDLARAAGDRARYLGGEVHRSSESAAAYEHDVTWPDYKHASAYLAKLRAEALVGRPSAGSTTG